MLKELTLKEFKEAMKHYKKERRAAKKILKRFIKHLNRMDCCMVYLESIEEKNK